MIPTGPATKVFLASGTTDLRKGSEGLGDLVRHRLKGIRLGKDGYAV